VNGQNRKKWTDKTGKKQRRKNGKQKLTPHEKKEKNRNGSTIRGREKNRSRDSEAK
jgi:hypothetical protein